MHAQRRKLPYFSIRRTHVAPVIGAIFWLSGMTPLVDAQGASEVRWRTNYAAARKEAEQSNRPLFIDFGTTDCFWCKKLDETTLRDSSVASLLNEKFIALKVDAHQESNLANLLRISSYPTLVLAAPDGRILNMLEGYQDAGKLTASLRSASNIDVPSDWVQREFDNARQWVKKGEYARAVPALRTVLDDTRKTSLQAPAAKLLEEIETRAADRIVSAEKLAKAGKPKEAMESLTEAMRIFAGTKGARNASESLLRIANSQSAEAAISGERAKRAKELLAQAKSFYDDKSYIPCLDRCEALLEGYSDLEEGREGAKLATEIKSNPAWMQAAADVMSDRLALIYLSLAETLVKRGQPDRAAFYLQRVVAGFPGSRQAESAQIRLSQIQTIAPRPGAVESAATPKD